MALRQTSSSITRRCASVPNVSSSSLEFMSTSSALQGKRLFSVQGERKTFQFQDKLPRLPVPPLQETLKRYLEYVEPLITPEQYATTSGAVLSFLEKPEEGARLQEELQNLDKESPTSWLEGFWDTMYLTIRDPLPINVNPYFVLNDDPLRKSQTERAAGLIHGATLFYKSTVDESLAPDMEKDVPLCAHQYSRMFGSTRIPRSGRDECPTFVGSRHIVVTYNNQLYALDVIKEDNVTVIGEPELRLALEQIINSSKDSKKNESPPFSVLTAGTREHWAATRSYLIDSDPSNRDALHLADSALFALTLEPESPSSLQHASHLVFHGDMTNRWFDKFQFVVLGDGTAGVNVEHTPIDGHSALRLMSDIPLLLSEDTKKKTTGSVASVRNIKLSLDSNVHKAIDLAQRTANELAASNEHVVLPFSHYGSSWIKKAKVSPDAWVQMAYQLAYYKLKGQPRSTYESAMTKRFLHGRTETLRSVTRESVEFTKLFTSPAATNASKEAALRKAADAHVRRMSEAKSGKAVDRHLWVLYKLALHKQQRLANYNIPALFTDPSYSTLASSVLSTSNCGSDQLQSFGFGAVVPEGLGLGYMIHNNCIPITVSSFQREASSYAQTLEQSLLEMRDVLSSQ